MTNHKNKKQKVEKVELESPVNGNLLTSDSTKTLRASHDKSGPYKHIVLDQLCTDERMRKIHHEITINMKADFKETDLFKVFQTGDLATLDSEREAAMPNLFALRKAIYSAEFRQFVQDITGCGELTDRVDCSCNAYAHGCHLLCHDDVIGTRRISYIIYLTDPDDPWTAEDGGALELYPLIDSSIVSTTSETEDGKTVQLQQGVPTSLPGGTLLPTYNTMLIFAVQPGRSYHSVQEVFSAEKPRISISGWYHATTPPVGADRSSLKQIMTLGDDHRVFSQFTGAAAPQASMLAGGLTLSKKELKQLGAWINPNYLAPAAMKDINEQFCANSSLQLNDFIRADVAFKLTSALITTDEAQNAGHGKPQLDYALGTSEAWELVGPPHKRRHLVYQPSSAGESAATAKKTAQDEVGAQLDAIRQQLFRSAVFAKYLQIVTALEPLGYKDEVRRFRPGLDYTVAHYGVLTKVARLDATLCFVNDDKDIQDKVLGRPSEKSAPVESAVDTKPKKEKKAAKEGSGDEDEDSDEEEEEEDYELSYEEVWDGGEVGGFECYIEAEEDPENAEAAEVYRGSYNSVNGNTKSDSKAEKAEKDARKKSGGKEEEEEEEDNTTSLLSVSAMNNTLNLVMRDEGVMKFIKYVSANAPGSRWDIAVEYEITPPEGEEDSSEGSDDSEEEDSEEGSEEEES